MKFDKTEFLKKVKSTVSKYHCVVVASEGIQDKKGKFISDSGEKDSFGHAQLGGVAPMLSNMIMNNLKLKVHWAVSDYLQRAAR